MIIYKVTNIVNGKIYIGQTTKTLKRRKSVHYGNARCGSDNEFAKALMEHSKDCFVWEEIHECSSLEELNKMETLCINESGSLVPNGYNMTEGGFTSPMINPTPELLTKHRERTTEAMQSFRGENNPMKRPEVIKKHKIAVNDPEHRKNHSEWMKENYRHSDTERAKRCMHQVTIEKDGIQLSIINLKQWCLSNSYNYASFRQSLTRGSRSYKDLIVINHRYISARSQPISPS